MHAYKKTEEQRINMKGSNKVDTCHYKGKAHGIFHNTLLIVTVRNLEKKKS